MHAVALSHTANIAQRYNETSPQHHFVSYSRMWYYYSITFAIRNQSDTRRCALFGIAAHMHSNSTDSESQHIWTHGCSAGRTYNCCSEMMPNFSASTPVMKLKADPAEQRDLNGEVIANPFRCSRSIRRSRGAAIYASSLPVT